MGVRIREQASTANPTDLLFAIQTYLASIVSKKLTAGLQQNSGKSASHLNSISGASPDLHKEYLVKLLILVMW